MKQEFSQEKEGFTLIELSIVMVVIGLVVVGIMSGKMLIQQAETRAAASQLQKLETSYRAFQTKYGCIIGDCTNATDFFGMNYIVASGCPPSGGAGNGNGNGDGFIDESSGSIGGTWSCEAIQAAKSLQLSNLLPTSLTNPCSSGATYFKGINDSCAYFFKDDLYATIPASKINAITWANYSQNGNWINAPALSPVVAYSIDTKIDDGIANKGKFRGLDSAVVINGPTVVGSCSVSGVYNQNETYSCRSLYYIK